MRPTVGRSVHFYGPNGVGPFAATVTKEYRDPEIVDLTVFKPAEDITKDSPSPFWIVQAAERSDEAGPNPRWCWPPRE